MSKKKFINVRSLCQQGRGTGFFCSGCYSDNDRGTFQNGPAAAGISDKAGLLQGMLPRGVRLRSSKKLNDFGPYQVWQCRLGTMLGGYFPNASAEDISACRCCWPASGGGGSRYCRSAKSQTSVGAVWIGSGCSFDRVELERGDLELPS